MDSIAQWTFFELIFGFLDHEAEAFRDNLLGETLRWTSGIGLSLLALWIGVQGYRIATGQSHDSMIGLATRSLRSFLIVSVATSFIFGSTDVYRLLSHGLPEEITFTVTGQAQAPEDLIDQSLDKMQAAMIAIDALSVAGNPGLKDDKDRAQWFTGIGVAGPAVIGGAWLLLYKLALALFVGLGPVFILSLLFDQTKNLFGRWLYYGLGTLFSLAVLSFMVALTMKLVLAIAGAYAAQYLLAVAAGASAQGVSSLAMQQGGVGLVMTVLLLMTPRMAAQFFQGTLGDFAAFSAFGGIGRRREEAVQPGQVEQGQQPAAPNPTHAYRMPGAASTQEDRIKRAPEMAQGSFLERYPNALASNTAAGGGSELPAALWPIAAGNAPRNENLPPPIDSALDGLRGDFAKPWVLEEVDLTNLNVYHGQVTFNAEGNDNPNSPYYSRHLHWPGGESGVTLGRGYDMRYRTSEAVLLDLLGAGVNRDSAERFSNGAGLSGEEARDFVQLHREEFGEISRRAQRRLFEDVVYPNYVRDARNRYTNAVASTPGAPAWEDLDSRVQNVAADMTYQQGRIYRRQMPFISANDTEALARYIETTPELSQYEGGRNRAAYLRGTE